MIKYAFIQLPKVVGQIPDHSRLVGSSLGLITILSDFDQKDVLAYDVNGTTIGYDIQYGFVYIVTNLCSLLRRFASNYLKGDESKTMKVVYGACLLDGDKLNKLLNELETPIDGLKKTSLYGGGSTFRIGGRRVSLSQLLNISVERTYSQERLNYVARIYHSVEPTDEDFGDPLSLYRISELAYNAVKEMDESSVIQTAMNRCVSTSDDVGLINLRNSQYDKVLSHCTPNREQRLLER